MIRGQVVPEFALMAHRFRTIIGVKRSERTLPALIIVGGKPQETRLEGRWRARSGAKVDLRPIRSPVERRILRLLPYAMHFVPRHCGRKSDKRNGKANQRHFQKVNDGEPPDLLLFTK
jgi:hypothetical protein